MNRLIIFLLLLLFSSGCTPVDPFIMNDPSVNLFWPQPPDPARIRYLRDIKGPEDIFPDKSRMLKFTELLTGDNRVLLELMTPSAVSISSDDILYIADTYAGIIHRYDLQSREVFYITRAGDEYLASPVALAVDQNQNLYVSDSINLKVYKYNSNGILINSLSPPEGFKRPAGIAITAIGEKFIVDALANKLHKFSIDDQYIGDFLKITEGEDINTPSNIALDASGNIYLTDAMNFVVRLYDRDGNFVRKFGGAGDVPGSFARPKGISLDSDNNIYVVDANHDNTQIFNKDGQLLLYFGNNGAGPGQFYLPNGIFIDRHDRIFIADTFNRRIQVFKLLKTGDKK